MSGDYVKGVEDFIQHELFLLFVPFLKHHFPILSQAALLELRFEANYEV